MLLNFSMDANSLIIRVCTKLHNFCIRMSNFSLSCFESATVDPTEHGIDPYEINGTNETYEFGYLPTDPSDDVFFYSCTDTDPSRRNAIVADISSRAIQRPDHNIARNND